jgi:hypothetical protein
LKEVFSVGSMPRLSDKDQLPLWDSPLMAVTRVGVRCVILLPACEDVSPEVYCWNTLPSIAVNTMAENSSLCMIVICEV